MSKKKKEEKFVERMTKEAILHEFEEKTFRPKIEDTHVRRTMLIRRDLDQRVQRLAEQKGHGFRTFFYNTAVENALNLLEDE